MTAKRLVPATDDAEFPYEAARAALLALGAELAPKRFAPLIAAGKRAGWTAEMLEEHNGMAARGRCFDFRQTVPPSLQGTLFEDNVFFAFTSGEHEDACQPVLERLARELGVRLFTC